MEGLLRDSLYLCLCLKRFMFRSELELLVIFIEKREGTRKRSEGQEMKQKK